QNLPVMDRRRACLSISAGSTAPTSNILRPDPSRGTLPRVARVGPQVPPAPPLRCARRALRSGGGSLLWTTRTTRNVVAQVGRQTTHQQITADLGSHRHDRLRFPLILPDQAEINMSGRCFDWYRESDTARDAGEA